MSEEDKKKKDFIDTWKLGMKHWEKGHPGWQVRLCVILGRNVAYTDLGKLECWKCPQFVLNEGVCDPL